MCHLPLTKGEVGASTVERSSFLSVKSNNSNNSQQTCIHTKFLRNHDMHDMQHTSRHMICMMCNYWGHMNNIK